MNPYRKKLFEAKYPGTNDIKLFTSVFDVLASHIGGKSGKCFYSSLFIGRNGKTYTSKENNNPHVLHRKIGQYLETLSIL